MKKVMSKIIINDDTEEMKTTKNQSAKSMDASLLRTSINTPSMKKSKSSLSKLNLERDTYDQNLEWLLAKHPGKYVLIKGTKIIGFYKSQDAALKKGFGLYLGQPFFVHQILANEEPVRIGILIGQ
jgi:hypothetical protein